MKVVEFKREEVDDALVRLKKLVADLESGELPQIVLGVLVMYDTEGGLFTVGLGKDAVDLKLIAVLELGKVQLTDMIFANSED